jgi:hypothetical protein
VPPSARVVERCAAHPARPAADHCPRCGRPRCAPDRDNGGSRGCLLCPVPVRPVGPVEVLVRAGLAGYATAAVGGWIATQYVGVHVMSLLVPAVVGLAVAASASAACGRPSDAIRRAVTLVAAAAALLGVGLGFRLFPISPVESAALVAAPYACALAGVLAWPILFGPVRRRPADVSAERGPSPAA